jgi:hypothetical protein
MQRTLVSANCCDLIGKLIRILARWDRPGVFLVDMNSFCPLVIHSIAHITDSFRLTNVPLVLARERRR